MLLVVFAGVQRRVAEVDLESDPQTRLESNEGVDGDYLLTLLTCVHLDALPIAPEISACVVGRVLPLEVSTDPLVALGHTESRAPPRLSA